MTHNDLRPGDKIRLTGWDKLSEPELFAREGNVFPCEVTLYNAGPLLLCLKDWSVRYFTFEFIERFDGSKTPKSVLDTAPEMLEALESVIKRVRKCVKVYDNPFEDDDELFAEISKAESIIKKAKCEQ